MSGCRSSKRLRNLSPSPQPDLDEYNCERRKHRKSVQYNQSERKMQQQSRPVGNPSPSNTVREQECKIEGEQGKSEKVSPPKLMYKDAAKLTAQQQQPFIRTTVEYPQHQAESSTMDIVQDKSEQTNKQKQQLQRKSLKTQRASEFKEVGNSTNDQTTQKNQSKGKYDAKKKIIRTSKKSITAQVVLHNKRKQKNQGSSTHVNNHCLLVDIQKLQSIVATRKGKWEDLFKKELEKFKFTPTQEDGTISDLDGSTKQQLQKLIHQYNEYTSNSCLQEEFLDPTIELLEIIIELPPVFDNDSRQEIY